VESGDYLQIQAKYETVEGICTRLRTDTQSGLNGNLDDLCQRRKEFGMNELPETKPKTFLQLVLAAVSDKVLIGLLTVATLVIIFGCVQFENGQSASNV
jgi:Ca2+-transporting ATPase